LNNILKLNGTLVNGQPISIKQGGGGQTTGGNEISGNFQNLSLNKNLGFKKLSLNKNLLTNYLLQNKFNSQNNVLFLSDLENTGEKNFLTSPQKQFK
jgi:hypothetical protein